MPTVGNRKFPYSPGGQQAATSFARRTGQQMQMPGMPATPGGAMAPAAAPAPIGARPSPTAARPSKPKARAKGNSSKSKGSSKRS